MPYRLSGNDDDDEDNDGHGANNLILAGNFSASDQNRITCMYVISAESSTRKLEYSTRLGRFSTYLTRLELDVQK